MPCKVSDETKQFYTWVQTEKGAAKWLVGKFELGKTENHFNFVSATISEKKLKAVKKDLKKDYAKAKEKYDKEAEDKNAESKEDDEAKKVQSRMRYVNYDKDSLSKGEIEKSHYDDFIKELKATANEGGHPAIGVLELFTKVFYVTYCPDTIKSRPKMTFGTARTKIKDTLSTTNVDIQATDNDGLTWEEFLKSKPPTYNLKEKA